MFRIRTIKTVGWFSLFAFFATHASSAAESDFAATISHGGVVDIGVHYQSQKQTLDLALVNDTDATVQIDDVVAVGPFDTVESFPQTLEAGERGTVRVGIWSLLDYGVRLHGFRIDTEDSGKEPVMLQVKNFGISVVDEFRPSMDLGVARLGKPMPENTLSLSSQAVADFRLTKVLDAPEYVSASITDEGQGLHVTVKPGNQWGPLSGYVQVGLNTPQQKEAWIKVDTTIQGKVIPDFPEVKMGLLRQGNENSFLVPIRSTDGKLFAIKELTLRDFKGAVHSGPCVNAEVGCKLLTVHISDEQETGKLNGAVLVEFPEYDATLQIPVSALLVTSDAKVVNLDEPKLDAANGAKSAASSGPVDIAKALKTATSPPKVKPPEPPGTGPVLRWQVGNQQTLYGYLIYRASSADGPFVRVNDEIILVKDPQDTNFYVWRDTTAEPGKTYWYYVSTLATNGQKQQLSGAQKVVANQE